MSPSAEDRADQQLHNDPMEDGLHTSETESEVKADAAETEAPVEEQQRIAQLAREGLALVDAAFGYGDEGAYHSI